MANPQARKYLGIGLLAGALAGSTGIGLIVNNHYRNTIIPSLPRYSETDINGDGLADLVLSVPNAIGNSRNVILIAAKNGRYIRCNYDVKGNTLYLEDQNGTVIFKQDLKEFLDKFKH